MDLDNVLNGESITEEPTGEPPAQEPAQQEPAQAEPAAQEPEQAPAAPPAATHADKTVPLTALEAERQQRQDWKAKALRYEGELEAYRRQQTQQPQAEPEPVDPLTAVQNQVLNERFNMSEMIARRDYQDLDEKLAIFEKAAQANPALAAQLRTQPHPWDWMYKEAQKIQLMSEIGDNPASYREKLKAELMAELGQQQAQAPATALAAAAPAAAPAAQIPQSLATARSAGARTAPAWSGPSTLDSILGK